MRSSVRIGLVVVGVAIVLLAPHSVVAECARDDGGVALAGQRTGSAPLTVAEAAKLDPALRVIVDRVQGDGDALVAAEAKQGVGPGLHLHAVDTGASAFGWTPAHVAPATMVRAIVLTDDPVALTASGAEVRAFQNGVASVAVPVEALADLARISTVSRVMAPTVKKATNDYGRADARIPEAYEAFGVDGAGSTVVVVDSGIDFTHQSFIHSDGRTRVKALLDMSDPGDIDADGRLDGDGPGGGTLFSEDDINQMLDDLASGHAQAYEWRQSPALIPDNGTLESEIRVSGRDAVDIDMLHVRAIVYHEFINDVGLTLVAPSGREVELLKRAHTGSDAIFAHYEVQGLEGESTEGVWTLQVHDHDRYARGYLVEWDLLANHTVRHRDFVGHGTHVAGTAAGDDAGTGATEPGVYAGVAPAADLVVVAASRSMGGGFADDDLMVALNWSDGFVEPPFVTNLSLGGFSGPRDGTTAFERFLDGLVGPGVEGRAIVASAGNEGDRESHIGGVFYPEPDSDHVPVEVPARAMSELIEVWFAGPDGTRMALRHPVTVGCRTCNERGGDIRPDCAGMQLRPGERRYIMLLSPRDTILSMGVIEWSRRSKHNGQYQLLFMLYAYSDYIPQGDYQLGFLHAEGPWNAWASVGEPFGELGDNSMTIGNTSSGKHVIAVGSHTTRLSWRDVRGRLQDEPGELDGISEFSSRGPTSDGRMKPELTAPGEWIVSARGDAAVWPAEYEMAEQRASSCGTSMSAPFVTGATALLLSVPECAELDASELREALIASARVDAFTGDVPNAVWGHGKLDAISAIAFCTGVPVPTATDTPDPGPTRSATVTPAASGTPTPEHGVRIFLPSLRNLVP